MSQQQDDELSDDAFARQLGQRLAAAAEDVPADVAGRLQAMRRQAALAADVPARRPRLWLPAVLAGTAAVALAVGVSLTGPDVPPLPQAGDLELAASQDLELLEDLEFLAWLDEEDLGAG